MNKLIFFIIFLVLPATIYSQTGWKDLVVTENTEVYIDSTNVKVVNGRIYATTKTIYTTEESKNIYINKIKSIFKKDADKKIARWKDFSYVVTEGVYDCSNKRFKITSVTDYNSNGTKIINTKTKKEKWLNVDIDTVGDYLLFYICDFENR